MTGERPTPSGSETWQPGYLAQHQAEQSRYLDRVSGTALAQAVAAHALDLLRLTPGQHVLEVGCGNGVFLPLLAREVEATGQVVGLDHADTFVAEARAKLDAAGLSGVVTVRQGDASALPFAPSSFDAAHCERVLMHLEDPGAAIREMARVVRPGGWIVAAEPDWSGIRIDHPDRAAFDRLYARAMTARQPDVGLTLYRRMGEAGLVERSAHPAWMVIHDYELMRTYGLALEPAADALVADGALTRAHADALLAAVWAAQSTERFYCAVAFHVVAGRVPPES